MGHYIGKYRVPREVYYGNKTRVTSKPVECTCDLDWYDVDSYSRHQRQMQCELKD